MRKKGFVLALCSLCGLLLPLASCGESTSVDSSTVSTGISSSESSSSVSQDSESDLGTVTVEYRDDAGNVLETFAWHQASEEQPTYDLTQPTKAADENYYYVFKGWKRDFSITDRIVYVAEFEAIDYKSEDNWSWGFVYSSSNSSKIVGLQLYGFYDSTKSITELTIPSEIYYKGVKYPVLVLGSGCIQSQTLKVINIPASVNKIDPNFIMNYYSQEVSEINVDSDNQTYKSVDGVVYSKDGKTLVKVPFCWHNEDYILPSEVEKIGDSALASTVAFRNFATATDSHLNVIGEQAFAGSLVRTLYLPEGLTTIKNRAFWLCDSLQVVEIPSTFVDDGSFLQFASCENINTVTFREGTGNSGVTTISDSMFQGCDLLASVVFPKTLKEIKAGAFSGCSRIKGIYLPEGFEKIDERAFYETSAFCVDILGDNLSDNAFDNPTSKFNLPSTVTTIGSYAFGSTSIVGTVNIPAKLTSLDPQAFVGDASIDGYSVAEGNKVYASKDGALYSADLTSLLAYPTGRSGVVTIPDGVKTIGTYALASNSNLREVKFSSSVQTVASYAFFGNSNLVSVTFNEGLKEIGVSAFSSLTSLENISFPSTLTDIGNNAFADDTSLKTISWGGVTTIGSSAFTNCSALTSLDFSKSKVIDIAGFAFYGSNNTYTSIDFGDRTYHSIGNYAFSSAYVKDVVAPVISGSSQDPAMFGGLSNLVSLDLGNMVLKSLPYGFDCNSKELTKLVIPSSVTSIPEYLSLGSHPKLTQVDFRGTKAQWNELISGMLEKNKAANFFGSNTQITKVVCADGEVAVTHSSTGDSSKVQ